MKQTSTNNITLSVVGVVVKTYFKVGTIWSSVDAAINNRHSENKNGFYTKIISAEIATYLLLQHFIQF